MVELDVISDVSINRNGAGTITIIVMAGLVPAIHVFECDGDQDVDARHKAGHDDAGDWRVLAYRR
jgi:hypothetical protein